MKTSSFTAVMIFTVLASLPCGARAQSVAKAQAKALAAAQEASEPNEDPAEVSPPSLADVSHAHEVVDPKEDAVDRRLKPVKEAFKTRAKYLNLKDPD